MVLVSLLMPGLLGGCAGLPTKPGIPGMSPISRERTYGATCSVYLENLPPEYDLLPEELRKSIELTATLRNVSSDKTYKLSLTEANGYRQKLDMLPGAYDIHDISISGTQMTLLSVEARQDSVSLVRDRNTDLPIYIKEPAAFVDALVHSRPSEGILASGLYDRIVQYNGELVDLNNIRSQMLFPANNDWLSPRDVAYIHSSSHTGVTLIVQNQTGSLIQANEASSTGVSFSNVYTLFPKGITVGTGLSTIVHRDSGILGTPAYCLGSPLLGFGIGTVTLVYLDSESGDRVSFSISENGAYVTGLTYEFAKYE